MGERLDEGSFLVVEGCSWTYVERADLSASDTHRNGGRFLDAPSRSVIGPRFGACGLKPASKAPVSERDVDDLDTVLAEQPVDATDERADIATFDTHRARSVQAVQAPDVVIERADQLMTLKRGRGNGGQRLGGRTGVGVEDQPERQPENSDAAGVALHDQRHQHV